MIMDLHSHIDIFYYYYSIYIIIIICVLCELYFIIDVHDILCMIVFLHDDDYT